MPRYEPNVGLAKSYSYHVPYIVVFFTAFVDKLSTSSVFPCLTPTFKGNAGIDAQVSSGTVLWIWQISKTNT